MSRVAMQFNNCREFSTKCFLIVFLNIFGVFFRTVFNTASSAAPQIAPTDSGIEPRTVATGALAVQML
jgi:hypothetical protein